jgi:hypothetical protein
MALVGGPSLSVARPFTNRSSSPLCGAASHFAAPF